MNTSHTIRVSAMRSTILAAALALVVAPAAIAQETSRGAVVVYPVVFSRNSGSSGSRQTAVRAVQEVLEKAGYTLISGTVAANTWASS
jgi:ABC-type sugar transport system substrate-binding protein